MTTTEPRGRVETVAQALKNYVGSEQVYYAAERAVRALDTPAAAPPLVDGSEGARRVSVNVRTALGPFLTVLREDLDQHVEPSEIEQAAINAIHEALRVSYELEQALQEAGRALNRAGRKVAVEYVP